MKIPHPKDPHGDLEGSVLRGDVLNVLFRHEVTIRQHDNGLVDLERGDTLEAVFIPEFVGGLLVRRISRVLGIDVTEFYAERQRHLH